MTDSLMQRQQAVLAGIATAEDDLKTIDQELKQFDVQLQSLSGERRQYQLLETICTSLDALDELGAAQMFWGQANDSIDSDTLLSGVRANVSDFQQKLASIEAGRKARLQRVEELKDKIEDLGDALLEIDEQIERAKDDYLIEREARPLPYRPMVMPWSKQGEDERRYRKVLALVLLLTITFGGTVPYYTLPERDKDAPVEIPEHLVKLVQERKPPPPPPEPPREERPEEEKPEEPKPTEQEQPKPKPTPVETQQARQVAESSGVLAFKDTFADLLTDDLTANLGASATLSNRGSQADPGAASRNLVTAEARSTSGGIDSAALSRNVGGGGGDRMGSSGVEFARVESAIGTDSIGADRPLSDGAGPSRTDQEIQIVFDRYKSVLYRIYNRELRVNPTLRGKMVLRLTIEPDGSVSAVSVESSDLASDTLSAQILERVRSFNFGPKDGVPSITIRYPIDFLPAS